MWSWARAPRWVFFSISRRRPHRRNRPRRDKQRGRAPATRPPQARAPNAQRETGEQPGTGLPVNVSRAFSRRGPPATSRDVRRALGFKSGSRSATLASVLCRSGLWSACLAIVGSPARPLGHSSFDLRVICHLLQATRDGHAPIRDVANTSENTCLRMRCHSHT